MTLSQWTSGLTITASGLNNIKHYLNVTTPTSSYTILHTDDLINMTCSAPCIMTLPIASGVQGKSFFISKKDTTSNHITILTQSGQSINSVSSYDLRTIYGRLHIKSNGTGYDEIGTLEKYGMIKLWSGAEADIPNGYTLCNGSNGTPDLRNNFVMGAGDTYAVDATGGAATHTLTVAELAIHNHTITTQNGGSTGSVKTDGAGAANSASTNNAGSGNAHNNIPPFYALCYIMRI